MEKQESIGFIELCLRVLNNDLKHFKLCCAIVLIPTIAVFVAVMWVIKPCYRASAIVTPPAADNTMSSLNASLSSSLGGMSSLLGLSSNENDANAVWTILNSWELHDQVIREFNLKEHYEFDGDFHADLLKKFRKNFGLECNDENMFVITVEDEDYALAAKMVQFMLDKADSAFNHFKTTQARQTREYFQSRLDSCDKDLDSLLAKFVKFQVDNNFYDPEIQMESTIKYIAELQAKRDEVGIEMAYEKANRGADSKRYDELSKRYNGINNALNGTLGGRHKKMGMVALKQSPELGAEYMRIEAQIRVQESLYKFLRQQSEQLRIEESKMLTNLHVIEPPWANNKKVFPLRGVTLIFTVFVSFLLASIICSVMEYLRSEESTDSTVAKEWRVFKGFFKKSKV
ncbi:MAG: lipopolysaccharide biosynthesis protein [Fibrobacter sp.]|uniref:lipopolysaccharide biosynthesis protein n=1 Tax=Fibrobacter sp. UWP2 TaxID=1896216 RepID=UPI0009119E5C|nr:lipopolysaccharide biosynthesis protein [Fibrobacter sp. UWP2]MBO7383428.1 lipopolysaccharide biosynthesis protein [Fibrobacter sp.]SHJ16722.1 Chain length determinant protein [Fibrobacter sp. UWP2]